MDNIKNTIVILIVCTILTIQNVSSTACNRFSAKFVPQPDEIPGVVPSKRTSSQESADGGIYIPCNSQAENKRIKTGLPSQSSRSRTSSTSSTSSAARNNNNNIRFVTDIAQLDCQKPAIERVIETSASCVPGVTDDRVIHIGWQQDDLFFKQITVCHSPSTYTTWFANHTLDTSTNNNINSHSPPSRSQSRNFRNHDTPCAFQTLNFYPKENQKNVFARIYGPNQMHFHKDTKYLSRGHLTPFADFTGDSAKSRATNFLINAVPQWQPFNNGNWSTLEDRIRSMAKNRRIKLDIYTGTYGVLALKDANNVPKPVYLGADRNNNQVLPVPKYLWKVVHDPASRSATAFVGFNFAADAAVDSTTDQPCPIDRCSDVQSWVGNWRTRRTEPSKSYRMVCCSVKELRTRVPYAPYLDNIIRLL